MLRQEELVFLKAISSFQVSPTLLKELSLATARRKKSPAVPAGRRGTQTQKLADKRKDNELASSDETMEPVNRRATPVAGSLPLPAPSVVKGEPTASGSPQPDLSGVGATYGAVLSASVSQSQLSGTLKLTVMDSDTSDSRVSTETSERRSSHNMSGPLSDTPNGTTMHAAWSTPASQQGRVLTRRLFLFQWLVTHVAFWPGSAHTAFTV